MKKIKLRIDREILEPGKTVQLEEKDYLHNRHLDNLCVYQLISHPNLVEKAASILGGDLVL